VVRSTSPRQRGRRPASRNRGNDGFRLLGRNREGALRLHLPLLRQPGVRTPPNSPPLPSPPLRPALLLPLMAAPNFYATILPWRAPRADRLPSCGDVRRRRASCSRSGGFSRGLGLARLFGLLHQCSTSYASCGVCANWEECMVDGEAAGLVRAARLPSFLGMVGSPNGCWGGGPGRW
jgi:hypothetical protein